ncbi:MAG: ATP-binding protein, partial [Syntrophomonadaceae bacterium]
LIIMVALFLLVIGVFYWLILDDIKKRKAAELKLKKNEAFLFMIFNEAKDALLIINSETNLAANCNKAAVEMFDVKDKSNLLNSFIPRFHKIPFEERDLIEINAAIEKEGVWKGELEYVTEKGRQFWGAVSVNAFEFNSETHKLLRITDITERKNSDQVLRNYAEALEESKSKLYMLTSELLLKNNELKKSEIALKELNADKDKFFSILAHDMRSPFTGLLGMSQYIADYNDIIPQGEIKELSGAIYGSAKKVYGLLTNLLEWSRLQMGKIEYLPSDINLYEISEEILDLLLPNVSSKYINMKNEISSEINVFADQNMVSTILRNLISNAIKFTNAGGEITLSSGIKDQYAEIRVSDTGIGMSDEVLEKIFRIDSKHTSTGTSGEEGTGLGLILCKELIEKNKGCIRVESQAGRGTEFLFTLPLAQKEEAIQMNNTEL